MGGTIDCTEQEERVFSTLLDVVRERQLSVTLRAAGGWVRDKLLGLDSDSPDVDLAVDCMSGKALAEKVAHHLEQRNGHQSSNESSSKVGVIAANPEQSKHLETATMRLHGVNIDFVNLRAEEYAQDSRIPFAGFGTPSEDAFRRDLTINSLFYNLHTRSVEDFTQFGMQDLRNGIVRTPLAPRQTLLDDPLRALRAIRFASRFGFAFNTELLHACYDPEVKEALRSKVTPERVGIELDCMLNGPAPHRSLSFVTRLELFSSTFVPKIEQDVNLPPQTGWLCAHCSHVLSRILQRVVFDSTSEANIDCDSLRLLRLAAYLLPMKDVQIPAGKKGKILPFSDAAVRSALKLKAKDAEAMPHLHNCAMYFKELMERSDEPSRLDIGLEIRRAKRMWRESLLLGALMLEKDVLILPVTLALSNDDNKVAEHVRHVVEQTIPSPDSTAFESAAANERKIESEGKAKGAEYAAERALWLLAQIDAYKLKDAWQEKPLLDGKRVMETLGWNKGGPELGQALDKLMEWQLANPSAGEDDARAFLRAQHAKNDWKHDVDNGMTGKSGA